MAVKKKPVEKKVCSKCSEEKSLTDFYIASDDLIHKDGRIHICKTCLENLVGDFTDVDNLIEVLRRIDKPFYKSLYDNALTDRNPFGRYFKDIAMVNYKGKTYADSEFDEDLSKFRAKNSADLKKAKNIEDVIQFKVSPELIAKWGNGYSETDIYLLEDFYKRMERSNEINTPQHIENLKLLCKLSLKQNKALDDGNSGDFAKLNTQYNKILQDSGFRPIDRVSGGEAIGVRSFSQIWEEMEKYGFIPKHDINVTQDIVDGTILHTENYTRRLLNMQIVSEPSEETPKVEDYSG